MKASRNSASLLTGYRMARGYSWSLVAVTLLASGCGGGGSGGDDTAAGAGTDTIPGLTLLGFGAAGVGQRTSPWLVFSEFFRSDSNTPGSGDGTVVLVGYEDTFPVSQHVAFYTPSLDTCQLRRQNAGAGSGAEGAPPAISGGTPLSIDDGGTAFFNFDAVNLGDGNVSYSTDNGLSGPLPDGATLSIPGDRFPALVAYPLPDEPPVVERLLPDAQLPITASSEYAWLPGGNANDYIKLEFIALDAQGEFVDFPVVCLSVDDGNFALPADARAEIDTIDDAVQLRYTRERGVLGIRDDITIYTRVIVAE